MFRRNEDHRQLELFNIGTEMPSPVRRRLENSWAPVFYEHVFCQIDEEPFAVLYSEDTGRPNFPVNILVGLEILAACFAYSVEEMLEQFYFNVQFRWALGIRDISDCPVSERTIYEFRQRLYAHALTHPGRESLIHQQFDSISDHLMSFMGLVREEMRMDSTQLMSNIRRAGRLSLSYDMLKQVVAACPHELLPDRLLAVLQPEFKRNLLYRVQARDVANRFEEMIQLCAELVCIADQHQVVRETRDVQLLARFVLEQAAFDEETQVWVAKKQERGTTSQHLHSAYDPDATCRKKGDEVYIGYVANIAETCAEENPVQLITDYALEPNNVADTTMAKDALPRLADTHGTRELYVDGGYSGEDVHTTASGHGISMYYTNMTGKETSKIPISEFTFDGHDVTHCPAGHPSVLSIYDPHTGNTLVHFAIEHCRQCRAKHACPTKSKRQAHTITITRKQRIAAETRKQIQDKNQHRINTSKRAATEGTNSALKRKHGAGKLPVRGINKCEVRLGLIALAHNFKQVLRWVRGDKRRSLLDAERQRRKGLLPAGGTA